MVVAGGNFLDAGGNQAADNLAVWNGTTWQPYCAAVNGTVNALEVVGSVLYVGGAFADANAVAAADNLFMCDAATGAFLGATVDNDLDINAGVQALTSDAAGNLYAGGDFTDLDGIVAADYVAMFNGAVWSAMPAVGGGAAIDTDGVDSLASDGTNVYVGTGDENLAGIPQADNVGRWDGTAWNAVGTDGSGSDGYFSANAVINGLLVSGSNLYATGNFADADSDPFADQIAVFDGTDWSALGTSADGTNGPFIGQGNALAFFGGAPVVGGAFTDAGGDPAADRIATFRGVGGGGTPAPVQGVAVNLAPVSGTVLVDIPGDGLGFIPLDQATQVPVGSKVDTTNGRVSLTSATKPAARRRRTSTTGCSRSGRRPRRISRPHDSAGSNNAAVPPALAATRSLRASASRASGAAAAASSPVRETTARLPFAAPPG